MRSISDLSIVDLPVELMHVCEYYTHLHVLGLEGELYRNVWCCLHAKKNCVPPTEGADYTAVIACVLIVTVLAMHACVLVFQPAANAFGVSGFVSQCHAGPIFRTI